MEFKTVQISITPINFKYSIPSELLNVGTCNLNIPDNVSIPNEEMKNTIVNWFRKIQKFTNIDPDSVKPAYSNISKWEFENNQAGYGFTHDTVNDNYETWFEFRIID